MSNNGSKGLKKIVTVLVLIILVALGVAGYGYYNGMQVQSYAKDGESMFNAVQGWGKGFDNSKDSKATKDQFSKIKNDSDKFLSQLNAKNAPSKAKELESNLKEYFTISKTLATDMEALANWAIGFEKIGKDMENIGSNASMNSPADIISAFKDMKTSVDAYVKELDTMQVPAVVSEQNKAMKDYLGQVSTILGSYIKALESNDLSSMVGIETDLASFLDKLNAMKSPEESINKVYKDKIDRADSLEKSIPGQISNLKSVTFAF
ncbi:hypothetical protein AUJ93_01595 [bacterium CG2_30_33_46]|nr:MAG: hypothetical protein AUJ93_01595 [bacterium CG2_30_33_46]